MYINNRQKIEDNKKEINDNNKDKTKSNSKFNKVKLSKLNKNISQLPKLHKENKIINPFIRCSSDVMINKYQIDAKEKENEEYYKEEVLIIKNLWEELGITKEYQIQFNYYLQNENLRKTMFFQEKEKLQKFRNSLMKLRKEIISRENNIESLIKIIKILESERMQENLLNEIIGIIKSLRLNAVNIVFYMMKIRELAFYYYFQGKWDLTKIKRDYLYNNNYLLKMRDDLGFLNNSILRNYIEMNNETTDAFFTNCSKRSNNCQNKVIIPMTDELEKLIDQCRFIIIEDQLLDNIYNNNYTSQFMSRASSGKIRIRKNISLKKGQSKNNYNYLNNIELNNSMSKYQQNYFNSINLSKTIFQLKNDNPSNYNSLFLNNPVPNINSISNLKDARKKFESARIKLRSQDKNNFLKNNINKIIYNYENPKKIIIEHDSYDNKTKKEKENKIFKSNENHRTNNNYNISNPPNSNSNSKRNILENEKINEIINENEKLKNDNEEIKKELQISKEKMEKNENLRKNLEQKLKIQKDEMEKLANSVEEIKLQLINEKKELEKKLEEEKEKNQKMEKIRLEMEAKMKNQIINKEIELQIYQDIKNNNIENENDKTESIKEDENVQNKSEEKKYLNNNNMNENDNENYEEIKEDLEDKNDNENNDNNNIYAITNSEKKNSFQKNNESNDEKDQNTNSKKEKDENSNSKEEKEEDKNSKESIANESNEEMNKLIEKEKEIIHARQLSEKIVDELINIKEYEISPNNKYKAEYFKGDIASLINKLKDSMPLEKIDNRFKIAFDIENNIYNEDSYILGQYPHIIICKSYENEKSISGVCSFYFQNTSKNENKLKINFICAINESSDEDEFEQFISMINFIKYFVNFDELYITLNYNKQIIEEEKIQFNLDQKILEFFKIQMKFSWVCIENINGQGRKQQLCYKNEKTDNNLFSACYNKEFFNSETIYLLSFIKKDEDKENQALNVNKIFTNYKFINYFPIYAILTSQKDLLQVNFKGNKYRVDSTKLNLEENPIITAFFPENKTFEELKSQLNEDYDNIYDIIEDSLFLENYNNDNNQIYSYGFFKMNLNIFFKNILITKIGNYYYNRIKSNEIQIINDIENNCTIYNIACLNKINNTIVIELNDKIKNILLGNNSSIYELFIKFYKKIQKEKSDDLTNKNIYIPCFNLDAHLQTEKLSKEINDINIESINENNSENNINIKIGTVDEFLKIDFDIKKLIDKQIMYEKNNSEKDIVLKNDFILGVINNYTEIKYPFFQLIYVTKENWVKIEEKKEKE